MPYELVALDLDGTLLDPQHRISPANSEAVRACIDSGVAVLLASGRMSPSIRRYSSELELQGTQIASNGAVLADASSGTLEISGILSATMLATVVAALMERSISFVVYEPATIYALPRTHHLGALAAYGEPRALEVPTIDHSTIEQPQKVLAFLEPSPLDEELRALMGGLAEVVRTGPRFLEFMMPGVSKGAALELLMARKGIPPERVLAIGDSFNDLSMFAVAGMSVAMGGCDPGVLAHAHTQTASCTEDGVALALQRFVLGQPQVTHDAA